MFESRAQKLGLVGARSPKAMASRTKRSLRSIRARIETLAAPYEEIDSNVELIHEELLAKFDEFEKSLDEVADWMNEEAPY